MAILSTHDIDEMNTAWNLRRDQVFQDAIEEELVSCLLLNVPHDLKGRFLYMIQHATSPKHLEVPFGILMNGDYTMTAMGWGDRRMGLLTALRRTKALDRVAAIIGPKITVAYSHNTADNTVEFVIRYFPPRPRRITLEPEDDGFWSCSKIDPATDIDHTI